MLYCSKINLLILFSLIFNCCDCIYLNNSNNTTKIRKLYSDNPAIWTEQGVWGSVLEEWATGTRREKRVMQIPIHDAYVLEEPVVKEDANETASRVVKESKISPGKIITYNTTKKPPGRQVSETDLYLLGAIEKLVYRVDFMEKRLRRVEEMLYYVLAGNRVDTSEPCPDNFTRAGPNCYYFSSSAGREHDWKIASKQCKLMGAILAEMETIEENQDIVAHIQNNQFLRGKDFWTGGLNPGLLWIWSNSARPVAGTGNATNNKKPTITIHGDGRCLRLAYDPALRSYAYKGSDCGSRYGYICEIQENTSSNELRRLGKSRKIIDEL